MSDADIQNIQAPLVPEHFGRQREKRFKPVFERGREEGATEPLLKLVKLVTLKERPRNKKGRKGLGQMTEPFNKCTSCC